MLFVGVDVHVRNSMLCVKDLDGRIRHRGRVGNTLGEFAQALGPFETEAMRVSLETTTNSRAVARMLQQYGHEAGVDLTVEVLDARKLRIIAESVRKTDAVDAAALADLTRSNLTLPAVYVPDDEVFALREHLRARADLVRVRTMMKNRLHALLHRRGILRPQGDVFTKAGRAWLGQVELDATGRELLDRLLESHDQLTEHLRRSITSIREVMRRPRWAKGAALLRTMPGVGEITALTVLSELGDLDRFKSRAAVANYAGLTPIVRSSNEKTWQGGISHRGSSHLRRVLVEAAWAAIPRVPGYHHLYERIKSRRGSQPAIVAVARQMLEDMFTMLRKDEAFRFVAPPRACGGAARGDQTVATSVAG